MAAVPTQTCWGCMHFDVNFEPDYSEFTPGSGLTIDCHLNHFYLSERMTTEEFGAAMEQGFTCPDYEPRKKGKNDKR